MRLKAMICINPCWWDSRIMRVYLSQVTFHKNKHTASSFATSRMLINARGVHNNQVIRKFNNNIYIQKTAKEKRVANICYSFLIRDAL